MRKLPISWALSPIEMDRRDADWTRLTMSGAVNPPFHTARVPAACAGELWDFRESRDR